MVEGSTGGAGRDSGWLRCKKKAGEEKGHELNERTYSDRIYERCKILFS